MTFQLVRATDTGIAVWQTEHGHIYGFAINADTNSLTQRFMHHAPDAGVPAADCAEAALRFATEQARDRQLIDAPSKRRSKAGRSRELA